MTHFRKAAGVALLTVSLVAVVQTLREVRQALGADWTASYVDGHEFTFAGRTITTIDATNLPIASTSAFVQQERVR